MLPERCDCCDYDKFYIKPTLNDRNVRKEGLYCQRCGKFLKWLNKRELDVCSCNRVPMILYGQYRDIPN